MGDALERIDGRYATAMSRHENQSGEEKDGLLLVSAGLPVRTAASEAHAVAIRPIRAGPRSQSIRL